jgi:hypothetical protein
MLNANLFCFLTFSFWRTEMATLMINDLPLMAELSADRARRIVGAVRSLWEDAGGRQPNGVETYPNAPYAGLGGLGTDQTRTIAGAGL